MSRRDLFCRITNLLWVLCVGLFSVTASAETLKEPIRIETGLITGVAGKTDGVRVFKGIPYAAPPVGDLRWRPPVPAVAWEGVKAMDQFSGMAMQSPQKPGSFYQLEFYPLPQPKATEDCLYLNVWTAAKSDQEKRPVMVWLHGGGGVEGYAHMPVFDGETLARKGVVLVSINMRLGIFGFFAHPELTQESEHHASGNYQIHDTVAALQWVRRNIRAFGGNPDQVTIFGSSAGGGRVLDLMTISQSEGLFHRAIIQSKISRSVVYTGSKLTDLERRGVAMAESLGVQSVRELRALSAEQILTASQTNHFGPCIDGWLVTENFASVFARGAQHRVPLLAGVNADEMGDRYKQPKLEAYRDELKKLFSKESDSFLQRYPAGSDTESAEMYFRLTYESSLAHSHLPVRWQTMIGQPAYFYYFDRKPPQRSTETKSLGAFHSSEVPYVFDSLHAVERPWEEADRRLADQISSYWVNFAANGNPNGVGLPVWPTCNEKPDLYMELGDHVRAIEIPDKERLNFCEQYFMNLGPKKGSNQ